MSQNVAIQEEFITLGQFLKLTGIIGTGGAAKWFLSEYSVLVNDEPEERRGRKLFVGDKVEIEEHGEFKITR